MPGPSSAAADQLEQLRFLHEVARLATTARTWDELLETVVDGTRDALHADVSSLYLLDRDGAYLTLAATNGLDRFQIGRARVPFGEGVTGRVAADPRAARHPRRPGRAAASCGSAASTSGGSSPRCSRVPLSWHDQVVGVLNVQTEQPRDFTPGDVAQLGAIADLLAGIVEKGRQQIEAEARVDELRRSTRPAASSSRSSPMSCARRSPSSAPTRTCSPRSRRSTAATRATPRAARPRAAWHDAALAQVERLDRLVDSILASVRVVPDEPAVVVPIDVRSVVDEVVGSLEPLLAGTTSTSRPASGSTPSPTRRASARSSSTSSRTP